MKKILACIDGSPYADTVCTYAAAFAKTMGAEIDLLHVLRRQSSYESTADRSGAIGLGARSSLHEQLLAVDEARGKLDQQKGKLILSHGKDVLLEIGAPTPDTIHRRGPLVQTLQELEAEYDILFVGKRGEHAEVGSRYLGSNLEKVARGVQKPLFVATSAYREVRRFLIAFDGKQSTLKAVDFFVSNPSLNHLDCHILSVGDIDSALTQGATAELKTAGYSVTLHHEKSGAVEKHIDSYVEERQIDWLAMGAYSHSPLRNLFLGSTSASLILSSKIPLILFH